MTIDVSNIPSELKALPNWVLWKPEERAGAPTKIPYCTSGAKAKANDPSTWSSFDECYSTYKHGNEYGGIGFAISKGVGIVGFDLDESRNPETGAISDEAARIVSLLRSYTEVSPSGRGLHIFIYGALPGGRRRKGLVEMYDSSRFLTVTGMVHNGLGTITHDQEAIDTVYEVVFGTETANTTVDTVVAKPTLAPLNDEELLMRAASAKNGAKFQRLYQDSAVEGYPSDSEADLALCAELAFWSNGDREQMDRLFRRSARNRPKWDERHGAQTYGQMTIAKACEGRGDEYRLVTDADSSYEQYFDGSLFRVSAPTRPC